MSGRRRGLKDLVSIEVSKEFSHWIGAKKERVVSIHLQRCIELPTSSAPITTESYRLTVHRHLVSLLGEVLAVSGGDGL